MKVKFNINFGMDMDINMSKKEFRKVMKMTKKEFKRWNKDNCGKDGKGHECTYSLPSSASSNVLDIAQKPKIKMSSGEMDALQKMEHTIEKAKREYENRLKNLEKKRS